MNLQNIRRLWSLSHEERARLILGFVFLVISSATLLYYPQAIKTIIDEALGTKDQQKLNEAAVLAFVVFAVHSVTAALRYYFFTIAGESAVKRLRSRLYSKIINQKMSFFDRHKTGELIGRLSNDTAVLQSAMSVNISMLIRSGAQALGAILMLFFTSMRLSLFVFIVVPPLIFLVAKFGRKIKSISKSTHDSMAYSMGVAEESISGVRTVKAFAQENYEERRYKRALSEAFSFARSRIQLVAQFSCLVQIIGLTVVVFVVWYGGHLVVKDEMTVGTLTAFLMYVMTLAFSVGMLGGLWADFMSAFGAASNIFQILESDLNEPVETQLTTEMDHAGFVFEKVDFCYPSRPEVKVLDQLSLSVKPLETIALVGESGGGKSTIVQLLMKFYKISSGSLNVGGHSIDRYSTHDLRRQIGLVPQEPDLISESVAQNICYGLDSIDHEKMVSASKISFSHDFICNLPQSFDTAVGEKGIQLSGGQKQRIALARAMIIKPKILILDEATSALDSQSEAMVQGALDLMIGQCTTLIVAHRLSTVKKADRILVIEKGKVVQEGSHEELLKDLEGPYHALVQHQFS